MLIESHCFKFEPKQVKGLQSIEAAGQVTLLLGPETRQPVW